LPLYEAVIGWLPTVSEAMENLAVPEPTLAIPRVIVPSRKVTVPEVLAVPGACTVTAAVKVTNWPAVEELTELDSAAELVSLLTVCVMADETLALKLLSPLYRMLIGWVPTASVDGVSVAVPELKFAVASVVAPSRNVTVPVGIPVPVVADITLALKVTVCPNTVTVAAEVSVVKLFTFMIV
jgi:hypothetical protein